MIDAGGASSLGDALESAFARWSGETCLIEADRDRENVRLTYAQLSERSRSVDAFFRAQGIGPDDRIAIVMTNQSKWHIAACAIFRAGGVLVPLDCKLDPAEHLRLLAHCGAKVLVVEHFLWSAMSRAEEFEGLGVGLVVVTEAPPDREVPVAPNAAVVRWEHVGATAVEAAPAAPRCRNDVACIVYSSGTGGRPKGCLLTHGNYLAQLASLTALHPMRPGVRYLSILPTNHAIDFMVGFLGPYLCGAAVVHLRTLRPELVREAFVRYAITHVALVPAVLKNLEAGLRKRLTELPAPKRAMLRALVALHRTLARGRPNPRLARRLFPGIHRAFGGQLEAVFVGGATTDPGTLRFFHDLGIPVANGYGLTEAGTALTLDRLDPPRPETVGEPLPGVELRIDEPDDEAVGEIVARGPTIMRGYLDDPELTAETIVGGWLKTGDLGRLEGGALRILGRRKNMIVTTGGKNVYPEDVENAFAGLAGAKESCVFAAHALSRSSRRDERLLLVVRLEPADAALTPGLREEIVRRNRTLPEFKCVKGLVVWEADFPRTASLKVRRAELGRAIAESEHAVIDLS